MKNKDDIKNTAEEPIDTKTEENIDDDDLDNQIVGKEKLLDFQLVKNYISEKDDEEDDEETEDEVDERVMFNKRSPKNNKKRSGKGRVIAIVLSCIAVFIIAVALICLHDIIALFKPMDNAKQFKIEQGQSISEISEKLNNDKIIDYPILFDSYCRVTGKGNKIQIGTFNLSPGMSYKSILDKITDSSQSKNKSMLLFNEGIDMFDLKKKNENVIKELNNKEIYSSFDFYKQLPEDKISSAYFPMEGFCAPNSYDISMEDPSSVAKSVFVQTDKLFKETKLNEVQSSEEVYKIITLASIIEKESYGAKDMSKISSVLHNRLNNSNEYPKLECDPTRKYGEKIDKELKTKNITDSNIPKEYNTYNCKGLPKGPICNPSKDAILAAMNPEKTEYYYFCANIKTKETFFSKTYEEHKQNLVKAGLK